MPNKELARARLISHGLIPSRVLNPVEVVTRSGLMQGQDLPGVIASVALRSGDQSFKAVLHALDAGDLVRGYPMRGTIFLAPATDLAWITQLCAAPGIRAAARRRSQLGLTESDIAQALDVALSSLSEHLSGLSRAELFSSWQRAGQPTDGGRGYHLLSHLMATGQLCYGPWNGIDQNVVCARSWLPSGSTLEDRFNGDRTAATAVLLRRYLTSHGPATVRDFAWWTKLPLCQIRAALPLLVDEVEPRGGEEPAYQRPGLDAEVAALGKAIAVPVLLPGFDEFILGYPDRLFAMTAEEHRLLVPGNNGVFQRSIVIDGVVRGLWKLGGRPGRRTYALAEFGRGLSKTHRRMVDRQFEQFPFLATEESTKN